ncbi:MAG TPA: Maf family protein [Terracidiphilus sp.]|jgi:septum formation protein|nr:Maf family protein [Terracidiphilus sp.]
MLILASASPRRKELLTQAGYVFQVQPAHLNEDPRPGEDAISYVTRLAREKAEAVYREIQAGDRTPADLIVLGADTTVEVDGKILGKPENAPDAARMLRLLSGRTHRVITGVALVHHPVNGDLPLGNPDRSRLPHAQVAAEVTGVRFLTLSEAEIAEYIATGEPMDKAGAYGIQGRAARWIPRIEGCYFNVVGLPLALVATMLEVERDFPSTSG